MSLENASGWAKILILSGMLLFLSVMFTLGLTSCDSSEQNGSGSVSISTSELIPSREDISSNRANEVFSSKRSTYPDNLITAPQLYSFLQERSQTENIYLLDTRPRKEWDDQGHIENAKWMQMQNVADPDNLAKLPKDKLIVCISPTGHAAVQMADVLRWLGYNAVVLEYGYGAWMEGPGTS